MADELDEIEARLKAEEGRAPPADNTLSPGARRALVAGKLDLDALESRYGAKAPPPPAPEPPAAPAQEDVPDIEEVRIAARGNRGKATPEPRRARASSDLDALEARYGIKPEPAAAPAPAPAKEPPAKAAPAPRDVPGFREWYSATAAKLGLDPNPDAPEHHYDYRAFYDAMKRGEAKSPTEPGGHWTSKFKTDDHPRAFLKDRQGRPFDTRTGRYADGTEVAQAEMDALNRSNVPTLSPEELAQVKGQWRARAPKTESVKDAVAGALGGTRSAHAAEPEAEAPTVPWRDTEAWMTAKPGEHRGPSATGFFIKDSKGRVFETGSGRYMDGSLVPKAEMAKATPDKALTPEEAAPFLANAGPAWLDRTDFKNVNVPDLLKEIHAEREEEEGRPLPGSEFAKKGKPTRLESTLRGALRAATLEHADEAAASIDVALGKLGLGPEYDYEKRRDEYRRRFREAEHEHPVASFGGEVIGSYGVGKTFENLGKGIRAFHAARAAAPAVTAAGEAAAGAAHAAEEPISIGKEALKGAGYGALNAEGESEAKTTKGKVLDVLAGAAGGALAGATAGKIEQKVTEAERRAEDRAINALKTGAQGSSKVKALGKKGQERKIREVIKAGGAEAAEMWSEKRYDEALEAIGKNIEPLKANQTRIYDEVQRATPERIGAPITKVRNALNALKNSPAYQGSAKKPLRDAIDQIYDGILAEQAKKVGVNKATGELAGKGLPHISMQDLHTEYRGYHDIGYTGGQQFETPVKKQLNRDVGNALRGVLQDTVEETVAAHPELAAKGITLPMLKRMNSEMSTWATVEKIVDQKAQRQRAHAGTLGQVMHGAGRKSEGAFAFAKNKIKSAWREAGEKTDPPMVWFAHQVQKANAGDTPAQKLVSDILKVGAGAAKGAEINAARKVGGIEAEVRAKKEHPETQPGGAMGDDMKKLVNQRRAELGYAPIE